jgi:amidohydrolase
MIESTGAPGWLDEFCAAHRDELVAFRRQLHAHPERSGEEHATTEAVAERLRVVGLAPWVLPTGTGVVCDIGAASGPTVALRADLDALAMPDDKTVPYRSQVEGLAHACGHDVHTTVVLGAGLALARAAALGELPGRVRLVFEPAEETVPGGAIDVLAAGGLDGVDVVYGVHCEPKLEVGRIGVRTGPITGAADMLEIRLEGPGGHTARPHLTVDLVALAGRVAWELPTRVAAASADALLLVFGALHAGDAPNVIPAHATLRGSVRTPDRGVWRQGADIVQRELDALLADSGATWELVHHPGVPPVVNDAAATAVIASAAASVIGSAGVVEAATSAGGDSFAWYLEHVPGSYVRLGTHDPADAAHLDLHAGSFDVDERAIEIGVRVLVTAALAWQEASIDPTT